MDEKKDDLPVECLVDSDARANSESHGSRGGRSGLGHVRHVGVGSGSEVPARADIRNFKGILKDASNQPREPTVTRNWAGLAASSESIRPSLVCARRARSQRFSGSL